jgi:hypothetical protein
MKRAKSEGVPEKALALMRMHPEVRVLICAHPTKRDLPDQQHGALGAKTVGYHQGLSDF